MKEKVSDPSPREIFSLLDNNLSTLEICRLLIFLEQTENPYTEVMRVCQQVMPVHQKAEIAQRLGLDEEFIDSRPDDIQDRE